MSMEKRMDDLRVESGTVTYSDPLTSFLYQLMRDHLPAGKVEELVWQVIHEPEEGCVFTNGWLAKYANNLADQIKNAHQVNLKKSLETAFEDVEFAKKVLANAAKISPPAEEIDEGVLADLKSQLDEIPNEDEQAKDVVEQLKDSINYLVNAGMVSAEEAETLKEELNKEVEAEIDPVKTDVQEKDCDEDNCCKKTGGECCKGDNDGRTPESKE